MVEKIFLILLVMLSIMSLNTPKLRRAVIYLGLFSLTASFIYLLYSAPDVAIAEAVIASGIATVLYLVAIKKYQVFTIYSVQHGDNETDHFAVKREHTRLIKSIEGLMIEKELEPQTVSTIEDPDYILAQKKYDLIIHRQRKNILIYGFSEDYHLDDIEKLIKGGKFKHLNISIIRREEGVIPNAQVD